MTEHVDLADPELHEPKGVAAAGAGMEYLADGAGSGSWIRIQGWAQYSDTNTTVATPTQNIATGVRTQMINDGGTTSLAKDPSDLVDPLWNVTTNKIIPIAVMDTYNGRLSFSAENYAGVAPYVTVELDIGGALGVIWSETIPLLKSGGQQDLSMSIPYFTGSTFLTNGGTIYLTYTGTATCDIFKTSIFIARESKNYV